MTITYHARALCAKLLFRLADLLETVGRKIGEDWSLAVYSKALDLDSPFGERRSSTTVYAPSVFYPEDGPVFTAYEDGTVKKQFDDPLSAAWRD